MSRLEIPLQGVVMPDADPYFADRAQLLLEAPSLPVERVDHITDRTEFSRPASERPRESGGGIERMHWSPVVPVFTPDGSSVIYDTPPAFEQFDEALYIIAAYEHRQHPGVYPRSIEVEADQRRVEAGKAQRAADFHRDGLGDEWHHFYLVSDIRPTEFLIFDRTTSQKKIDDDTLGKIFIAKPYEIVKATDATFHRSPRLQEAAARTFLRVMFAYNLPVSEPAASLLATQAA